MAKLGEDSRSQKMISNRLPGHAFLGSLKMACLKGRGRHAEARSAPSRRKHWNKENRFTGWTDVDLSEKGVAGGARGRRVLKEGRIHIRHRLTRPSSSARSARSGSSRTTWT